MPLTTKDEIMVNLAQNSKDWPGETPAIHKGDVNGTNSKP
jgi:hypothetical protein